MGGNDVSRAFKRWLETVTGTRRSGSYVSGRWVESGVEIIQFSGVVQSANPDDLKALPEGNRNDEAIKIHTTFMLIPQASGKTGDTVTYKGHSWLVHNVANRYIGNYHKAIAVKQ